MFTTMMIDDMVGGEVPRARAREHLLDLIQERSDVYLMLEFQKKEKKKASQEWGATQMGTVGLQNAQAIVGGPAGTI